MLPIGDTAVKNRQGSPTHLYLVLEVTIDKGHNIWTINNMEVWWQPNTSHIPTLQSFLPITSPQTQSPISIGVQGAQGTDVESKAQSQRQKSEAYPRPGNRSKNSGTGVRTRRRRRRLYWVEKNSHCVETASPARFPANKERCLSVPWWDLGF